MTLAALDTSEAVLELRDALAGGPPAWLVGGVVRDALLGRPLEDLDVAVDGDPRAVARTVAKALGGPAFALSEAFGSWRALDGRRRFHVDVSALQGATIEEDLGRRDFTVNAIAVPVGGGDALDPHGGQADLRAGVLQARLAERLRRRSAAPAAAGAPRGRAGPGAGARDAQADRRGRPAPVRAGARAHVRGAAPADGVRRRGRGPGAGQRAWACWGPCCRS